MKFPIFASFIIFILWLTYEIKKHTELNDEAERAFWEKESQANSVRKKNLDDICYATFPFEKLPEDSSFDGGEIPESLTILRSLKDKKMINLGGITNTDVKMQYGTANITILSEYDENYETFASNIYKLCQYLYDQSRTKEAKELSQLALATGSDVSLHYKLLAKIYHEEGQDAKINDLKAQAENIHSLTKGPILRDLEQYDHFLSDPPVG